MSGMESTTQFLERIGADGAKWAHEFKLTAEKLGHFGMDEGWLIGWFCNAISAGKDAAHRRASQAAPAHEDDLAVDRFAAVMKAKLAKKRNDGRGGWSGPECSEETLSRMLRDHVGKGDPVDVANFAMMLHQRGERIAQAAPAPSDGLRDRIARIVTLDHLQLLHDFGVDGDLHRIDPECAEGAYAIADAIIAALSAPPAQEEAESHD